MRGPSAACSSPSASTSSCAGLRSKNRSAVAVVDRLLARLGGLDRGQHLVAPAGSCARRLRRRFCSSQEPARRGGGVAPPSLALAFWRCALAPSARRRRRRGGRRRSARGTRRRCRGSRAGPSASARGCAWPARRRTSDRGTRTAPCPCTACSASTSAWMASRSRWLVGSSSTSTFGFSTASSAKIRRAASPPDSVPTFLLDVLAREQHPPQLPAHEGGGSRPGTPPRACRAAWRRGRSAPRGGPAGSSRRAPRGPSAPARVRRPGARRRS